MTPSDAQPLRVCVDRGSSAGVGGSCGLCRQDASQYLRIHKCSSCHGSHCGKCSRLQVKIVGDGTLTKVRLCVECERQSPPSRAVTERKLRHSGRASFSPLPAAAAKRSISAMSEMNLRRICRSPADAEAAVDAAAMQQATPYTPSDADSTVQASDEAGNWGPTPDSASTAETASEEDDAADEAGASPAHQLSLVNDLAAETCSPLNRQIEQRCAHSPRDEVNLCGRSFWKTILPFVLLLAAAWIVGRQGSAPLLQVNISMDRAVAAVADAHATTAGLLLPLSLLPHRTSTVARSSASSGGGGVGGLVASPVSGAEAAAALVDELVSVSGAQLTVPSHVFIDISEPGELKISGGVGGGGGSNDDAYSATAPEVFLQRSHLPLQSNTLTLLPSFLVKTFVRGAIRSLHLLQRAVRAFVITLRNTIEVL